MTLGNRGGGGDRFPSITMYYNAIQSDTAAGADAVADAWCGYTLILVFRREPYSVRYCNIVQIRVIKFKLTLKKLALISWTKS